MRYRDSLILLRVIACDASRPGGWGRESGWCSPGGEAEPLRGTGAFWPLRGPCPHFVRTCRCSLRSPCPSRPCGALLPPPSLRSVGSGPSGSVGLPSLADSPPQPQGTAGALAALALDPGAPESRLAARQRCRHRTRKRGALCSGFRFDPCRDPSGVRRVSGTPSESSPLRENGSGGGGAQAKRHRLPRPRLPLRCPSHGYRSRPGPRRTPAR